MLTRAQGKIKMRMSNRLSRARQSLEKRSISDGNMRPPKGSPPKTSSLDQLSPPPGFVSSRSGAGIRRSSSLQSSPPPSRPTSTGASQSKTGLEDRLAQAAKRVAACVANSDMEDFGAAMAELDRLKVEAKSIIQSREN